VGRGGAGLRVGRGRRKSSAMGSRFSLIAGIRDWIQSEWGWDGDEG